MGNTRGLGRSFVIALALTSTQAHAQTAEAPADPTPAAAQAGTDPSPTATADETPAESAEPQPAASPESSASGDGSTGNDLNEPRFSDANADRVILFSTAETHPKGTFFFSDYGLILLQFGYAFTDDVQLALTGVPPIVEDQPYFFDLSLKANLLRNEHWRFAVLAAGMMITVPSSSLTNDTLLGARANATGQICFTTSCGSSFSMNVGTMLNNQSNEVLPITLAGGLVVKASNVVKLLLEPAYALALGSNVDQPDGFLLSYGLRLSGDHFGFDLAFLRPVGQDSPLIMGIPWLSLTYRGDPDPRGQASEQ